MDDKDSSKLGSESNPNLENSGVFNSSAEAWQAKADDAAFLSLAQASVLTGYHQDYLGFLARAGKLEAHKIGRNWVTTKAAIEKFEKGVKDKTAFRENLPKPLPLLYLERFLYKEMYLETQKK